jgi:ADP-ribosyl-[dinitrogen reductase] hydrolase
MRIAPMVVPYLKSSGTQIWNDTALCAMITHNDSASIAACVSFVAMLWEALDMQEAPKPEWWLERYIGLARELETGEEYTPRGGKFTDFRGPVWSFVQDEVWKAYKNGISVLDACESWFSGAYLLETVQSVIYILMRHGHNFEEALIRAVNDTKDNDTIAAIVGAAAGALHGKMAIPNRWVSNLSGRTTDKDDGRVFEIIRGAKNTFWNIAGDNDTNPVI